MSKVAMRGHLKKFLVQIVIGVMIVPLCVPAQADSPFGTFALEPSPELEELANEFFGPDVEEVAPTLFFSATRYMADALENGKKLSFAAKWLGRILVIGEAVAVEQMLDSSRALSTELKEWDAENNRKIQAYFEALWGTFLNDPLYMKPSATNPNILYVQEIFQKASAKIDEMLKRLNFQCDPKDPSKNCGISLNHIFLAESFEPYYRIQNGKADFFVPATAFFVGTEDEKIQKVAFVLAEEIGLMFYDDDVNQIMNTHSADGVERSMFWSSNPVLTPMGKEMALKFWAAKNLNLAKPNVKKTDFQIFSEDFAKYADEYNQSPRNIFRRRTKITTESENILLSLRPQKLTTTKGPLTGPPVLSPCSVAGQDILIGHPLSKCVTIHIGVADNPRLKKIIKAGIKREQARRTINGPEEELANAAGVFSAMLFMELAGMGLQKIGFSKGLLKGVVRVPVRFLLAPYLGYEVGSGGAHLVSKIARDAKYGGEDSSKAHIPDPNLTPGTLEQVLLKLNAGDVDNIQTVIHEAFNTSDPDTVEILTKLAR